MDNVADSEFSRNNVNFNYIMFDVYDRKCYRLFVFDNLILYRFN